MPIKNRASNVINLADTTGARRNQNKVNAIALAKIGVAIFPSSGKVPLVPRFNKLDTSLSPEERELAIEEFREKHDGKDPVHVGATKNPEIVKLMWRAHCDAVPSISCGASNLLVLDADAKDNGPELMGALFAENGGVPEGVPVIPTKSGGKHFIFADPKGAFTNKAGLLKKQYGCDVRGTGGQIIAAGSVREDGRTYGTRADLAAFCRAVTSKKIPTLPSYVAELIGASNEHATDNEQVTPTKEREVITQLKDTDWPEFDEVFDATLGYDLDIIKQDDEFANLYDNPSDDCSTNRFLAARAIMRQWPNMKPEELAIFFDHWEGAGAITDDKPKTGEYDLRQIAREWIKNQGLSKPSNGDAFGAVVDDDEDPDDEGKIVSDEVALNLEFDRLKRAERAEADKLERERSEIKTADTTHGDNTSKNSPPLPAWFANAKRVPLDLDRNKLPPRPFLYGTYLLRGHTTLLSAAGGVGKSAWGLSAAIDLACGVDHLGAGEFRSRKVLIYNGEDDFDEMFRRISSYCDFHGFTPEMHKQVNENLIVISGVDGPLRFAEHRDGRVLIVKRSVELFEKLIDEHKIEIAILDPLIGLHSIPENDNSAMNVLITEIKTLTSRKKLATMIVHHDKKNLGAKSIEEAGQDDSRGAGTITTPMRIVLNMKRLNRKDAQRLRIPESDLPHIIALSKGAKSNYSPRDPGAKLFFAHSVSADNASEEFRADNTVALAVYKLKYAPRITDDQRDRILAEIENGEYRSDPQAIGPLVELVAEIMGGQLDAPELKKLTVEALKDWASKGWIAIVKKYNTVARRDAPTYQRGPETPPAAVNAFGAVDDEDDEL